jgi:hypothetical protein
VISSGLASGDILLAVSQPARAGYSTVSALAMAAICFRRLVNIFRISRLVDGLKMNGVGFLAMDTSTDETVGAGKNAFCEIFRRYV